MQYEIYLQVLLLYWGLRLDDLGLDDLGLDGTGLGDAGLGSVGLLELLVLLIFAFLKIKNYDG
jgi:hypothetical protein